MNIQQKPSPNFNSRHGFSPQLLVVHVMDGSLQGTINWFQNPASQVSSHYGIGLDGTVVQFVDEHNAAWTEGNVRNPTARLLKKILGVYINPNWYCLSIENEGHDLSLAPDIQLQTLAELLYSLAVKYNIPIDRDHIIGHNEVDGIVKINCPSSNHSIMDKIVSMVELLNNKNKNMTKYVKNFLSNGEVNTYDVTTNAVESVGQTHEFTSGEDAVAHSTSEVVVLFDGEFCGKGAIQE